MALVVARQCGYGHALDELSAAIRPAAAAYSRWQAILAALESELPDVGHAIAPDPTLAQGRSDYTAYLQDRISQMQEIARRYRQELDVFFERHPELLA